MLLLQACFPLSNRLAHRHIGCFSPLRFVQTALLYKSPQFAQIILLDNELMLVYLLQLPLLTYQPLNLNTQKIVDNN